MPHNGAMGNFWADHDRMQARLEADIAEVEYWEAVDPEWRDKSRDPEERDEISEWDMSPEQIAAADDDH